MLRKDFSTVCGISVDSKITGEIKTHVISADNGTVIAQTYHSPFIEMKIRFRTPEP
jgi:hypothetical protein